MSILVHRSPAMFAVDTEVVGVTRQGYLPHGPDKTAWPFTMQGGDSILCPAPATRRSRGVPLPSPGDDRPSPRHTHHPLTAGVSARKNLELRRRLQAGYFAGAVSLTGVPSTLLLSPCLLASFKSWSITPARRSCSIRISCAFFCSAKSL
jgi:hypothetical protein